jgi:hypothetical protein
MFCLYYNLLPLAVMTTDVIPFRIYKADIPNLQTSRLPILTFNSRDSFINILQNIQPLNIYLNLVSL